MVRRYACIRRVTTHPEPRALARKGRPSYHRIEIGTAGSATKRTLCSAMVVADTTLCADVPYLYYYPTADHYAQDNTTHWLTHARSAQDVGLAVWQLGFRISSVTYHLNASIGAFPCTPRHTTATAFSGRAASAADLRRAEMHYCCGETCSPDARAVSAPFRRCGCCAGVERLLMDLWLNSCKGCQWLIVR